MNTKHIFSPSEEYLKNLPQRELKQLGFIVKGNLVFFFSFLLLGITLFFQQIKAVPFLCIATSICFIICLILIKKDNLYKGVYISTIGIVIAVFIINFFAGNSPSGLIYYRNACVIVTLAICNQLVTLKRNQLYFYFIGSGLVWIGYVATTIKGHLESNFIGTISAVVLCTLSLVIANIVILYLNKFNLELVKNAKNAEEKAENNLKSITKIISDSKNGLEVGERLYDATHKASGSIGKLNNIYNVISQDSTGLSLEASKINNAGSTMKQQAEQMKNTVQIQNNSISSTSSDMQEITSSLSSLSNIAGNHKNAMNDIVQNLNNQVEQIKKIVDEVAMVQDSSKAISQFVQTVDSIASRTGLLAMNASIEAAHVGQQGKGFVVIAQEIRKLSNETTLNATKISDGLQENDKIVQETADSVAIFQQFTQSTTEELKKTIYGIEEILSGILRINSEAQNVMGSLDNVVQQSHSTDTIVDNVVSEIENQAAALNKMEVFTNTLTNSVSEMETQVNDIKAVLESIENEAQENVKVSRNITDSMNV